MCYKNRELRKIYYEIHSLIKLLTACSSKSVGYYQVTDDFQGLLNYKHKVEQYWCYLENSLNLPNDSLSSLDRKNFEEDFMYCTNLKEKINNFLLCYLNLI